MPPQQTENTNEKEHAEQIDFKEALNGILGRSLTPENIESYADSALEDLVDLTEKVVTRYRLTHDEQETPLATENNAFKEYNLGEVHSVLDHILQVSSSLKNLDAIIYNVDSHAVDEIITPPDIARAMILGGSREFVKRSTIPRLKTVLFLLKTDFGIDPENNDEIHITKGSVRPDMMRREGYYSIQLTNLQRTILICDEEGNATFVFDTQSLSSQGIMHDDLIHKTKEELNALIENLPHSGTRIVYSNKNFITDISSALDGENEFSEMKTDGKYLDSMAPEGYLTASAIARRLGVGERSVRIVINEIVDELDPIKSRVRSNLATFYSSSDQEKITSRLDEKGILTPRATDNQWSVSRLSKDLNIGRHTVDRAIQALQEDEKLGEVAIAKFTSYIGAAYNVNQKELIVHWLREHTRLATVSDTGENIIKLSSGEVNIEGYKNQSQFAQELGIHRSVLRELIRSDESEIGDVLKRGNHWIYSPAQQEIITRRLHDNRERKANALIPDNYRSRIQLYDEWGISTHTIKKAINAVSNELGEVVRANRSGNPTDVFSPTQQEMIYGWLEGSGYIASKAPEGYITMDKMSTELGFGSKELVARAIKELGEALGEVAQFKSYNRITNHYSVNQQQQIREWIIHHSPKGKLAQSAINTTLS